MVNTEVVADEEVKVVDEAATVDVVKVDVGEDVEDKTEEVAAPRTMPNKHFPRLQI